MKKSLLTALLLTTMLSPAYAATGVAADNTKPDPVIVAESVLMDTGGKEVGRAMLTQTQQGVLLDLTITKMSTGEHAFHIHEKGDCTPQASGKEAFTNAGAHLNPKGNPHGYGGHDSHDGDMPNIFVSENGTAKLHALNTRITLDPNDTSARAQIRDDDGAAIVVHASPDDYRSQPSGNAGDRIACGKIN